MSIRFVNVDRDQPMLLPLDLREWIPEDVMVHFVIEAVDKLALRSFDEREDGARRFPREIQIAKTDGGASVWDNHEMYGFHTVPSSRSREGERRAAVANAVCATDGTLTQSRSTVKSDKLLGPSQEG